MTIGGVEAAEKKKKSGLRKQNAQKKVACLTSLRWHASTRCSGSCLKNVYAKDGCTPVSPATLSSKLEVRMGSSIR
jgi:hypothetical protein